MSGHVLPTSTLWVSSIHTSPSFPRPRRCAGRHWWQGAFCSAGVPLEIFPFTELVFLLKLATMPHSRRGFFSMARQFWFIGSIFAPFSAGLIVLFWGFLFDFDFFVFFSSSSIFASVFVLAFFFLSSKTSPALVPPFSPQANFFSAPPSLLRGLWFFPSVWEAVTQLGDPCPQRMTETLH